MHCINSRLTYLLTYFLAPLNSCLQLEHEHKLFTTCPSTTQHSIHKLSWNCWHRIHTELVCHGLNWLAFVPELVYQVWNILVVCSRASFMGGKVFSWSSVSIIVGSERVQDMFGHVLIQKKWPECWLMFTAIQVSGFPGVKDPCGPW